MTYGGKIRVDSYVIITALWNKFIEEEGEDKGYGSKVFPNNKEFFENSFENAYDAAHAVSIGDWRWTDDFVYFNEEGYLVSFSQCDDETCPIDMGKIDVDYIVRSLQDLQDKEKRYVVNNIPKAIHDALK